MTLPLGVHSLFILLVNDKLTYGFLLVNEGTLVVQ